MSPPEFRLSPIRLLHSSSIWSTSRVVSSAASAPNKGDDRLPMLPRYDRGHVSHTHGFEHIVFIASRSASVTACGVSPKNVSRARKGLTGRPHLNRPDHSRCLLNNKLHRPLARHSPTIQSPNDYGKPILVTPTGRGPTDPMRPANPLPGLAVGPCPEDLADVLVQPT